MEIDELVVRYRLQPALIAVRIVSSWLSAITLLLVREMIAPFGVTMYSAPLYGIVFATLSVTVRLALDTDSLAVFLIAAFGDLANVGL